jgi:hypothetical protein
MFSLLLEQTLGFTNPSHQYTSGDLLAIPVLGGNPVPNPDCFITYYIGVGTTGSGGLETIGFTPASALQGNGYVQTVGSFDSNNLPNTQNLMLTVELTCNYLPLLRGAPIGFVRWDDFVLTKSAIQ